MESTQKMNPMNMLLAGLVVFAIAGSILWIFLEGGAARRAVQEPTTQSADSGP